MAASMGPDCGIAVVKHTGNPATGESTMRTEHVLRGTAPASSSEETDVVLDDA